MSASLASAPESSVGLPFGAPTRMLGDMNGVELRRATSADRSLVHFLHRTLYVEYAQEITPEKLAPFFAWRDFERVLRDDVDSLLARPDALIVLAESGAGEPLGYITGHVETEPRRLLSRRGVVEEWCVLPEARGKGVGRRLYGELEQLFRGAGCQVVESETWPFNEGARAAHGAMGFSEVKIRFEKRLED